MRTALDEPADRMDQHEQEFVTQIRECGWFSTSVFADDEGPGFSYTTGFWVNLGVPEVILFSLDSKIAHDVLRDIYRDAKNGRRFPTAARVSDIFASTHAFLFPVSRRHYAEYLGWSRWFYGGDEFPCLQLVWPDKAGRFPWDDGFEERFKGLQPDISPEGWVKALSQ